MGYSLGVATGATFAGMAALGAAAGFGGGGGGSIARLIMNIRYRAKASAIARHMRIRNSPSTLSAWPFINRAPQVPKQTTITIMLNMKSKARSDISSLFYALALDP